MFVYQFLVQLYRINVLLFAVISAADHLQIRSSRKEISDGIDYGKQKAARSNDQKECLLLTTAEYVKDIVDHRIRCGGCLPWWYRW